MLSFHDRGSYNLNFNNIQLQNKQPGYILSLTSHEKQNKLTIHSIYYMYHLLERFTSKKM